MFVVTIVEQVTETITKSDWVKMNDKGEYGYAPERNIQQYRSVTRYEQRVDEIDLKAIIAAVNK